MVLIHHQPKDGPFSELLNKKMESGYSEFTLITAFAKEAGVMALESNMREFREKGGIIRCYVGIDLNATSYDALHRLLRCTDELYICHDRRKDRIFHPKEYLLESARSAWLAIGSNNMTYTGLHSNVEGSLTLELDLSKPEDLKTISDFKEFLSTLRQSDACLKIDDSTLAVLLENGAVSKEIDIIRNKPEQKAPQKSTSVIFGKLDFGKRDSPQQIRRGELKEKGGHGASLGIDEIEIELDHSSEFWLETGKMTGGSRNILDLSKTGNVVKDTLGNATYSIEGRADTVLGSVTLFGIKPGDTSVVKDITISLNGIDYNGNTIKIETAGKNPNLSWRLQLKGESENGAKLTEFSFIEKLLVFQKVTDTKYIMRILEESEIDQLIKASCIVARNGISKNSRKYGILGNINDSD